MSLFKKTLLLFVPVVLLVGACNTDEENVAPTDSNEAITTATLSLTNTATPTEVVTATIDNLTTQIDTSKYVLRLRANTTYSGAVTLLDKTKTPTLNVSAEVKEEGNEHLFVYTFTPAAGSPASMTITATDKDTNPAPGPYPIGLTTQIRTGAVGSGKLNVVLRHQPDVKNGTAQPGSSDLDTDFKVLIQ
ncbi:hypothetical protein ACFSUS_06990 [Spirosoma soli]|uniref:Type 1 periplasmic binding fold superfamily protein n=1 Tax=Spirosoma soli TaxID=1770529 RepID=A0ABW5M2K3_9BACT